MNFDLGFSLLGWDIAVATANPPGAGVCPYDLDFSFDCNSQYIPVI